MGECTSARAQRASRQVHHTRALNLTSETEAASGDALGAFRASLVRSLWRSEKPPGHSVCLSEESRDLGGSMENLGDCGAMSG